MALYNKHKQTEAVYSSNTLITGKGNSLPSVSVLQPKAGISSLISSSQDVIQRAFTRSLLKNHVNYIKTNKAYHGSWMELDTISKYMVLDQLKSEGIKLPEQADKFVKEAGDVAEENSDIDHYGGGSDEIVKGTEKHTELLQLKRGPGDSGPKSFATSTVGNYNAVTYTRDGVGNVDFKSPKSQTAWSNPVPEAAVDLSESSKKKEYGMMLSGNFVHIPSASREQHFSIANRVAKKKGQTFGDGGASPANYTWHHLLDKYKMVLVDRTVHQKFGHNGGFYFW